jgi:hypothetical protein
VQRPFVLETQSGHLPTRNVGIRAPPTIRDAPPKKKRETAVRLASLSFFFVFSRFFRLDDSSLLRPEPRTFIALQTVGEESRHFRRRLLSQLGNLYAHVVTGLSVRDATSGYRCYRRTLLERLNLDRISSNGYAFQIEVAFRVWKLGLRIREIPILFVDRVAGQSKLDRWIVWEALWGLWRLRLISLAHRL